MRTLFFSAAVLTGYLAGTSRAQTLYVVSPVPAVTEISGPPAPPCGYPAGPVTAFFPALGGLCPGLAPFAAPLGDVASDPITDTVYATDGALLAAYTPAGVPLGFAVPPIPGLTGLGMGLGGLLWITDGLVYGAVPVAGIGCPGLALPFVLGPFPVPIGPIFAGPIADLDFEGATGSLLACDGFGIVGSFFPGPLPAPGPYGFFPMPPAPCPLAPGLIGIAFDKTLPGSGTFFVSDGVLIRRALPGGGVAPATFYFPFPCIPIPAPLPIAGLAFAGRQIPYGVGADSLGFPAPIIGSVGQSYVGNPAFSVTLAGSIPTSRAILRSGFAPACPATRFRGVPNFLAGRPFFGPSGPTFLTTRVLVGAGGGAVYTTAIPPAIPPGVTYYMQWMALTPVSFQVTAGAALTTMLP